jgi:hypothetical protein
MIVESAHYIAQFIWVLGNAIWAFGELYYGDRDDAYPLFSAYVTLFLVFMNCKI